MSLNLNSMTTAEKVDYCNRLFTGYCQFDLEKTAQMVGLPQEEVRKYIEMSDSEGVFITKDHIGKKLWIVNSEHNNPRIVTISAVEDYVVVVNYENKLRYKVNLLTSKHKFYHLDDSRALAMKKARIEEFRVQVRNSNSAIKNRLNLLFDAGKLDDTDIKILTAITEKHGI